MSNDQKKPDQELVKSMRQELAKGGDKAVERRYGPEAKGSAEYAEAQRQRRQAQARARSQHQRAAEQQRGPAQGQQAKAQADKDTRGKQQRQSERERVIEARKQQERDSSLSR